MKPYFFNYISSVVVFIFFFSPELTSQVADDRISALASARASPVYLKNVMDQYHHSFVAIIFIFMQIPDGAAQLYFVNYSFKFF